MPNSNLTEECSEHPAGHEPVYDVTQSDSNKSVFVCKCGFSVVEHEDAGTGA